MLNAKMRKKALRDIERPLFYSNDVKEGKVKENGVER